MVHTIHRDLLFPSQSYFQLFGDLSKTPGGLFYSMSHLSTLWYLKYLPFSPNLLYLLIHNQYSTWVLRNLPEIHHQEVQLLLLPQCTFSWDLLLHAFISFFAIFPILGNFHHVHVSLCCWVEFFLIYQLGLFSSKFLLLSAYRQACFFRVFLFHAFCSRIVVFIFLLYSHTSYLYSQIKVLTPSLTKFLLFSYGRKQQFTQTKWPCDAQVKFIHPQWKPYT